MTSEELRAALSLKYPSEVSAKTQKRRMENIAAFREYISSEKVRMNLKFDEVEERLYLYRTDKGEKICIQFPGKETAQAEPRPFDFRPKIITSSGEVVKDLVFRDMWIIVEKVNEEYHRIVPALTALFFRMGRMIDYEKVTEELEYEVFTKDNTKLDAGKKSFTWNKLCVNPEIVKEIDRGVEMIQIDDGNKISFEAFMYFFSLILENEDIKYNYIKGNLTSGRIPTSNSMLLLASHFNGYISVSELLQRFVAGQGVGAVKQVEIEPATSNIIKIVNMKDELEKLFVSAGLEYRRNGVITRKGERIGTCFLLRNNKIAVLASDEATGQDILKEEEYDIYFIDEFFDESKYVKFSRLIEEYSKLINR